MSSPPTPGQATGEVRPALPPLNYSLPIWESNTPMRPRSLPQLIAGLAMFAGAIWLGFEDVAFRRFEARLATPITGLVTGRHGAARSNDIVFFALGTRRAFGLQITNECTSALLLIPLLVMMGAFTVFSRVPLRREVLALSVGAMVMMIVNIVRVAGIGWSTYRWGMDPGYKYSHVFVGSAFSLVGFVGAMLLALWVLVHTERMSQPGVGSRPALGDPASADGEPDRPDDTGPAVPPAAPQAPRHLRRRSS